MQILRVAWLSIISTLGLAACGNKAPTQPLSQLLSSTEEGWADLALTLQSRERVSGGGERLVAAALHGTEEVAFMITLGPKWTAGSFGPGIKTHTGVVTVGSVGSRSDAFVRAVDSAYATGLTPQSMPAAIQFTGISLEGDPSALDAGPTKIKLFFESEGDERYAELYLNIDASAGRVEWAEKDQEYRKAIVQALSGA
ncbi:MAG: hypothetical protein JNL28_12730 [Planctomycetes bacterium]|nr:hypothetical protein [Planctomycetota bacterium]